MKDVMEVRKAIWNDVPEIWKLGKGVDEFMVADNTVDFRPKEMLKKGKRKKFALVLNTFQDSCEPYTMMMIY